MTPYDIGDLFTHAMYLVLVIVVVIIVPSLFVGLVVSTFQAATQINEQTLSFLPRLVVTLLAVIMFGPWAVTAVIDYTKELYMNIPFIIG
ncbi:MAG: flagellar biosynthetic protein FliQ [Oceanospirillaceae bacterium]|uniref:flagellar biosynthesis protein FliQ n=2 Tax=Pseudomonadota TaxID=1224 RepID=UPI000C0903BB|nr:MULTISPECIES: flagellar biosynthesis protein FliQ [Pseudomonadota]MAK91320.1 flagellar biosynthetic protein FliQ [Thalassolituus sp.]MAX99208.1 flagellar biosynthetic protein FliQ [Oceanospirillaceae bacterium]MAF00828.1 flagellar biosynthetic protein FliQ [Herbaspirillum sp.]MBL33713.1 flagellar biosynthetic protein FliQ [Oceanospirillaceae bacterium]MBS51711.1 flagellar biosynthetic protein FliQ [Oceanospirillaceae bacterium]|tara:strand:- start:210 stop:479 length:270 start_codon:yes stop_codon:yes gene_type:complete